MGREHATGAYSDVLFGNSMVAERMGSAVSVVVGAIALAISCIGVFALLSNVVRQRAREIGIRVAVGATPHAISSMVMREAALLLAAGLAVGIPSALAAAQLVRTLLYNVTVTDGITLTASIALLVTTALLAAARPTWQAVRVDPAIALRAE
jgi:ABC-type antimicrobial peptide transport system permease subunit